MDQAIARLAERQHGAVSVRQLAALGVTRGRLRARLDAGRLHRVHVGVYAVGHTRLSLRGKWMAAVLALGRGAVLSHRDGAALLDLRAVGDARIDVTVDSRNGLHRPGIAVHRARLHPEDRIRRDGIPVTSVPRTLLDLAEITSPTQLRRAYEEAARLLLLDTTAIIRLLKRSNGRRGVGRLRALLDYDPGQAARTRSELERLFLDQIRAASLPSPLINAMVDGYEVDAYWPDARLVVELDSYAYHSSRAAFERDHAKLARLRLAGYQVFPLTYWQVSEEPHWVAGALRQMLSPTV